MKLPQKPENIYIDRFRSHLGYPGQTFEMRFLMSETGVFSLFLVHSTVSQGGLTSFQIYVNAHMYIRMCVYTYIIVILGKYKLI